MSARRNTLDSGIPRSANCFSIAFVAALTSMLLTVVHEFTLVQHECIMHFRM